VTEHVHVCVCVNRLYWGVLYCTALYYAVHVRYCGYCIMQALYCTALYCTALYYAVQCACTIMWVLHYASTVLYCTALYCTAQHCTMLCTYDTVGTVLCKHCTLLHCTVVYCTEQHCTTLYLLNTVEYCSILYCTVLCMHCIALYCGVLQLYLCGGGDDMRSARVEIKWDTLTMTQTKVSNSQLKPTINGRRHVTHDVHH